MPPPTTTCVRVRACRYSKTQSGRYQRMVVDLARVAGQKFAAGLITQEQYDSIVDDLESGKTVVGDVF